MVFGAEGVVEKSRRPEPARMPALRAQAELFFDVAVGDFGGEAALFEGFFELLGEHDGAVFAAGAADGDGEVAFALVDVMGDEIDQETFDAAEKFGGLREGLDVVANFGIFAGVTAQAGDEMRIG